MAVDGGGVGELGEGGEAAVEVRLCGTLVEEVAEVVVVGWIAGWGVHGVREGGGGRRRREGAYRGRRGGGGGAVRWAEAKEAQAGLS